LWATFSFSFKFLKKNRQSKSFLKTNILSQIPFFIKKFAKKNLGKKNIDPPPTSQKTRGVSHYGLATYIKKYLKAKEELWKLKYFTMVKIV
jgi:hypothetical protein